MNLVNKMITCKEDLINTYIENDNGVLRDVYISLCESNGICHQRGCRNGNDWYDLKYVGFCSQWSENSLGQASGDGYALANCKQLTLTDLLPTTYENTKVYSLDEEVIRKYAELCGKEYNHDTAHRSGEYVGVSCVTYAVARFTDDSEVHSGEYPTVTITPEQILAAWELKSNRVNIGNPKLKTRIEWVKVTDSIFDLRADFECKELFYKWDGNYSLVHDEAELLYSYKEKRLYRRIENEVTWQEEATKFIDNAEYLGRKDRLSVAFMYSTGGDSEQYDAELIKLCHLVASRTKIKEVK